MKAITAGLLPSRSFLKMSEEVFNEVANRDEYWWGYGNCYKTQYCDSIENPRASYDIIPEIRINEANLTAGDRLKINGFEFVAIGDACALCVTSIGKSIYRDAKREVNVAERTVEKWFNRYIKGKEIEIIKKGA